MSLISVNVTSSPYGSFSHCGSKVEITRSKWWLKLHFYPLNIVREICTGPALYKLGVGSTLFPWGCATMLVKPSHGIMEILITVHRFSNELISPPRFISQVCTHAFQEVFITIYIHSNGKLRRILIKFCLQIKLKFDHLWRLVTQKWTDWKVNPLRSFLVQHNDHRTFSHKTM